MDHKRFVHCRDSPPPGDQQHRRKTAEQVPAPPSPDAQASGYAHQARWTGLQNL